MKVLPRIDLFYDWPTGGREIVYQNLLHDWLLEEYADTATILYQPIWKGRARPDLVVVMHGRVIIYELKVPVANVRAAIQVRAYMDLAREMWPDSQITGVLGAPRFNISEADQGDLYLLPLRMVRQ